MNITEITTNGRSQVSQAPDSIDLKLTVRSKALEYLGAVEELNRNTLLTLSALSDAGVTDKVVTSDYNVSEHWEWNDDKKKFLGYQGAQGLKVSFPIDMGVLSAVMTNLNRTNIKPRAQINFSVRDVEGLLNAARVKAIDAAKNAAHDIAAQMGLEVVGIKSVNYSVPSDFSKFSMHVDLDDAMSSDNLGGQESLAINMNPQEVSTTDGVTVVWEAKICESI
jgi:uncharacterized protein YggE